MYKIPAQTLFVGKHLLYRPSCSSTNLLAAELVRDGSAQNGHVIVTDDQTDGKGQGKNKWEAMPSLNLTFSIILYPKDLKARDQFRLSVATVTALRHFFYVHGIETQIKWPNDIYSGGKKLSGILVSNAVTGDLVTETIIGIGINVNQLNFDVPAAVSMQCLTGRSYQLPKLLEQFLGVFEDHFLMVENDYERLYTEFLTHLLFMEEKRRFQDTISGEIFEGLILGIDQGGRLKLESGGKIKTYGVKEIRFLG